MLITWIRVAAAQSNPTVGDWDVLPTAEARLVEEAFTTTGRAYGVGSFLDRQLFPRLTEGGQVLAFESTYLYDAFTLPVRCESVLAKLDSEPYCLAHADAWASTGGIASGGEHVGVFYAASVNGVFVPDVGLIRGMAPMAFAPLSVVQLYTAPFTTGPLKIGPGLQDLLGTSRSEYVIGLRGRLASVAGHVGFLGSDDGSGLFTNLGEEQVRALATALIRTGARSELPFLEAGLIGSPLLELLGAAEGIRPSLFVRKLRYGDPLAALAASTAGATGTPTLGSATPTLATPTTPTTGPAEDLDTEGVAALGWDLVTGHLGTTTPWVDVLVAVAVAPEPLLQELVVTGHSPNRTSMEGGLVEDPSGWGYRLAGGFVSLPAMPWYGQGARTSPFIEGSVGRGAFDATVAWNGRQTLLLYPYARQSVQVGATLTLGGQP